MPRRGVQPWYSLGTRVNAPFFKNLRQKAPEYEHGASTKVDTRPLCAQVFGYLRSNPLHTHNPLLRLFQNGVWQGEMKQICTIIYRTGNKVWTQHCFVPAGLYWIMLGSVRCFIILLMVNSKKIKIIIPRVITKRGNYCHTLLRQKRKKNYVLTWHL